jgi:hypothetical protein
MHRGDRREDILLIGTAQAAKSLLHHLAPEPPEHESDRMNKADGQLEFQSTDFTARRPAGNSSHYSRNPTGAPPGVRHFVWDLGFDRQMVNTPQEIGAARRNLAPVV